MIANKLSGWYYDLQLENRITSVTLHPNRVLNEGKTEWIPITNMEDKDPDFNITVEKTDVSYRKDPICRSILTEDFNISVANNWSDFGGDMLGQMWESLKPMAPYAGSIKNMIRSAVEDYTNPKNQKLVSEINESTVSSTLAKLMVGLNKMTSETKVEDYLNRALVVQGTRFSYYSGSGTSFGNLMMKFTIFPRYNEKGEFESVTKQVEDIVPYCIGKFVNGTDGIDVDKDSKSLIDNLIGWQKPPGGFKAYLKNVDVIQEGTLLLRAGTQYAIPNLVIENATFNFSKQMSKNPKAALISTEGTKDSELISPLYCDVTIQLRPVTKFSDKTLKEYVFGASSTKTMSTVKDKMLENLKTPKDEDYVY